MEGEEKGMTRRHTFFCINKERHTRSSTIIDAKPHEISIFGQSVRGWLVTTEEPVIDKIIPLDESIQGEVQHHDPE
jgi:hypothetical protein